MCAFELDPEIAKAGRDSLMRKDRVRALNDELRTTFEGGKVMLSAGVAALSEDARQQVLLAVRLLREFKPEDDPYEEHDFGAVICLGVRYFWKIDYFNLDLKFASPDPSDPAFTIRVLTIMRGDEY